MIAEERRLDKIDKRELIINVATNLFSEFGYHEVNMEMVAHQAGIAKGTIYNYFKSKEDLYFSINETRLERLVSELERKFSEQVNVLDDLRGYIIHVFMFLLKYKDFFLIFQRTRLKKQKFKSTTLEEYISKLKIMLMNILSEGVDKKVFKQIDVCFVADLILGMIYSAVLRNLSHNIHDKEIVEEREKLYEFIKQSVLASSVNKQPLFGKTILLTRAMGTAEENLNKLRSLGAEVINFPTIKIVPPLSWRDCDLAIKNLDSYDFILFTSQNAVEWFLNRVDLFEKTDILKTKKIISIGQRTSEKLFSKGLSVYFSPSKFNSETLASELKEIIKPEQKILFPQSKIGREFIQKFLQEIGVNIDRVEVYDVDIPALEDLAEQIKVMNEKRIDVYVFTSPSTFDNFLKILRIENPDNFFYGKNIASIGPTTKNHIEEKGVKVTIVPEESTFDSLINSIIKYFERQL